MPQFVATALISLPVLQADVLQHVHIWVSSQNDTKLLNEYKSSRVHLLTVSRFMLDVCCRGSLDILCLHFPGILFPTQARNVPDSIAAPDGQRIGINDPLGLILTPQAKGLFTMYGPSIKHNVTVLSALKVWLGQN